MKRLLFVLAAVFGFYFVSLWYTGQEYQRLLAEQLRLAQLQAPQIRLDLTLEEESLFGRTEHYSVEIDVPDEDLTLTVIMRHELSLQPFMVRGSYQIDWPHLMEQILVDAPDLTLTQVHPDQGSWSASVLTGQGETQYHWDGMTLQTDGTVEFLPLAYQGTMTLDMQSSEGTLNWQGVRAQSALGELEMGPVHYSGTAQRQGDQYLWPDARFLMEKVYFTDHAGTEFHMGQFDWITHTSTGVNTSEVDSQINVETLQLQDRDAAFTLALTNTRSDLLISGINTQAYLGLLKLNGREPELQAEEALVLVDQLLATGLKLRFRDLATEVDLKTMQDNILGQVHSRGDIELASTSMAKLQQAFAPYLRARLDIDFSANMFAGHELGAALEQMEQQGFLTRKGDKLVTEFQFAEGVIQLNQQPLPL